MNMNLRPQENSYVGAQSRMKLLPNYYRWICSYAKPYLKGTVLDLGCGHGHMTAHYQDLVDRIFAVDYDSLLLESFKKKWPQEKVRTIQADILGDWSELRGVRADAVLAMDILEHFENDREVLQKIKNILKPDGHVLVKVPAQSRMYSKADLASGHYRRYDKDDLVDLIELAGFKIEKIHYMNPLGALAYGCRRKKSTNFSKTFSPFQLKIINSCLWFLPLLDRIPAIKGLSLICVGKL